MIKKSYFCVKFVVKVVTAVWHETFVTGDYTVVWWSGGPAAEAAATNAAITKKKTGGPGENPQEEKKSIKKNSDATPVIIIIIVIKKKAPSKYALKNARAPFFTPVFPLARALVARNLCAG